MRCLYVCDCHAITRERIALAACGSGEQLHELASFLHQCAGDEEEEEEEEEVVSVDQVEVLKQEGVPLGFLVNAICAMLTLQRIRKVFGICDSIPGVPAALLWIHLTLCDLCTTPPLPHRVVISQQCVPW